MVCQGVIVHIRVLIGIKGEDWKASRLLLQTQCIAEINLLKECRKSDKEKKNNVVVHHIESICPVLSVFTCLTFVASALQSQAEIRF